MTTAPSEYAMNQEIPVRPARPALTNFTTEELEAELRRRRQSSLSDFYFTVDGDTFLFVHRRQWHEYLSFTSDVNIHLPELFDREDWEATFGGPTENGIRLLTHRGAVRRDLTEPAWVNGVGSVRKQSCRVQLNSDDPAIRQGFIARWTSGAVKADSLARLKQKLEMEVAEAGLTLLNLQSGGDLKRGTAYIRAVVVSTALWNVLPAYRP